MNAINYHLTKFKIIFINLFKNFYFSIIQVAFSRLMTRSFLNMAKEKFRLGEQRVMSYGPCQTPTLWFCAQRHKEIQNFRPEKFYIVSLSANLYVRNNACYNV